MRALYRVRFGVAAILASAMFITGASSQKPPAAAPVTAPVEVVVEKPGDPGTSELNHDAAADASLQNAANQASASEYARAQAEYEAGVAAAEAARVRYEEQLAANARATASAQADYTAAQARWRADVAACNAGDRSRCGGAEPAAMAAGQSANSNEERASTTDNRDSCNAAARRGGIGGALLGGVAGAVGGRSLGRIARFVPLAAVAGTLTAAIACRLNEREQVKASEATIEATRSEQVGTQVAWQSDTREDVRGTTTVVALQDAPSGQPQGSRCMLIDDVIIVNGEETVAQKRMCRVPPEVRYALAAA